MKEYAPRSCVMSAVFTRARARRRKRGIAVCAGPSREWLGRRRQHTTDFDPESLAPDVGEPLALAPWSGRATRSIWSMRLAMRLLTGEVTRPPGSWTRVSSSTPSRVAVGTDAVWKRRPLPDCWSITNWTQENANYGRPRHAARALRQGVLRCLSQSATATGVAYRPARKPGLPADSQGPQPVPSVRAGRRPAARDALESACELDDDLINK